MTVAFALPLIGTNRSERQTLRRRFDFYCLGYFCLSRSRALANEEKLYTKHHRTRLNAAIFRVYYSKNIKYFNYSKWQGMGIYFSCATMSKSIVVKASPSVATFFSSLFSPSSVLSLGLGRPLVLVVRPRPAAGTPHTAQQHRHFGYYVYINESKCGRRQTDKRKTEKTRKKNNESAK